MDDKKLNKKFKVLKVRDKTDNFSVDVDTIFDAPNRLLFCGASGSGKTAMATALLLDEDTFPYSKIYDGEDIYIFAPAPYSDPKLNLIIEQLDVPDSNVFNNYSDDILEQLYDMLVDEYKESRDNKQKPTHKLIILDDLSFSGSFATKFNALAKVYQNGRKFLVSVWCLQQYYNQVSPAIRMNSTGLIIWRTPNSQIEKIVDEHNYLKKGKKQFLEMWYDNIKEKHDYIIINYSNPSNSLYLGKDFSNITPE